MRVEFGSFIAGNRSSTRKESEPLDQSPQDIRLLLASTPVSELAPILNKLYPSTEGKDVEVLATKDGTVEVYPGSRTFTRRPESYPHNQSRPPEDTSTHPKNSL